MASSFAEARPGSDAGPGRASRPAVQLEGVAKLFGDVVAVEDIDLEIGDGEFFSMLGPSGSGKTTTLRKIAGFELPTRGRILLHGEDVSRRPPFERDVNTVFQDYALFPHMTVGDNVGYGLMIRKVPKPERAGRIADALRMVRLEGYEQRKPAQLSGGQRQRVALARALINRPRVLLLDEPLGALDLKLREEMQVELKVIQHEVGITFIYVTHDQQEALSMSDRIAVFNRGRVEQVGRPAELYSKPASSFVANFVGTSNHVSGDLARRLFGEDGTYVVRPERIAIGRRPEGDAGGRSATGRIREVLFLGSDSRYLVDLDSGGAFIVTRPNSGAPEEMADLAPGAEVTLSWQPRDVLRMTG